MAFTCDIAISSDNSIAVRNARAIRASAELRAERERLALQVEPLRRRIKELTQLIVAAETAAYED